MCCRPFAPRGFFLSWTSSASPGLLLPLLDFFCLSGLLLPLCVAGRCPGRSARRTVRSVSQGETGHNLQLRWRLRAQEDAGLLVVAASFGGRGPPPFCWWRWTPRRRKTKTNSVLPPVSLLGDQWTHAPTNAYACGLLHRPSWSRPLNSSRISGRGCWPQPVPRGNLSRPLPRPPPLVVAVSFHPRRDYSERETRPRLPCQRVPRTACGGRTSQHCWEGRRWSEPKSLTDT